MIVDPQSSRIYLTWSILIGPRERKGIWENLRYKIDKERMQREKKEAERNRRKWRDAKRNLESQRRSLVH